MDNCCQTALPEIQKALARPLHFHVQLQQGLCSTSSSLKYWVLESAIGTRLYYGVIDSTLSRRMDSSTRH